MVMPLLISLVAAPHVMAPAVVRADDPPIKVTLNSDTYTLGDEAKVRIRLADDGYVVVLRADVDGHVRVLFPLDPGADNFVRGGHTFEIRGRGDRTAFAADYREGVGTVLAAVSSEPFDFRQYTKNGHWDYGVLDGQRVSDDAEAGLLDVVNAMAAGNHFDYDVTDYRVEREADYSATPVYGYGGFGFAPFYPSYAPCWSCGYWYPGWSVGFGVGAWSPWWYGASIGWGAGGCWSDPFCTFGYAGFGYPYYAYGYARYPGYSYYVPRGYYYGYGRGYYNPFVMKQTPYGPPSIGVRERSVAYAQPSFRVPPLPARRGIAPRPRGGVVPATPPPPPDGGRRPFITPRGRDRAAPPDGGRRPDIAPPSRRSPPPPPPERRGGAEPARPRRDNGRPMIVAPGLREMPYVPRESRAPEFRMPARPDVRREMIAPPARGRAEPSFPRFERPSPAPAPRFIAPPRAPAPAPSRAPAPRSRGR